MKKIKLISITMFKEGYCIPQIARIARAQETSCGGYQTSGAEQETGHEMKMNTRAGFHSSTIKCYIITNSVLICFSETMDFVF